MERRRAVAWATGVSVALVLGSALVALGAGAFSEPPVDRVGSFESISASIGTSSTTTAAGGRRDVRAPTAASVPGSHDSSVDAEPDVVEPPSTGSVDATPAPRGVEPATDGGAGHPSTTVQPRVTTSSPHEREAPEPSEPSEHEPPEHEPRDD